MGGGGGGVQAANMLAPDFRFLWQFNGDLDLDGYLKEGTGPYATLRTALPDLFWNAYDFRVRDPTVGPDWTGAYE